MKKVLGVVFMASALFTSAWASNIGVIDVQAVFRDSPAAKKINSGLEKQFSSQKVLYNQALTLKVRLCMKSKLNSSKLYSLHKMLQ